MGKFIIKANLVLRQIQYENNSKRQSKRFKKTGSSLKSKSANRNHILTKQSTKRKRHNRGLNKLTGTVLKMASKLINR